MEPLRKPTPRTPRELPKKGFDPKLVVLALLAMLRRRWLVIAIAFLLSTVAAAYLSGVSKQIVWKANALLLYTEPPVPDSEVGFASAMKLANVSGFVTSRPVLERVHGELGLEFPLPLLEKMLTAETSRQTTTIFLALEWGDKLEAIEILDNLIQNYAKYVAETRQNMAKSRADSVAKQLAKTKKELSLARQQLQEFCRKHKIVDHRQDLIRVYTEIGSLETKSGDLRRDNESMADQLKMLDQHIESIKSEEAEASKEEAEAEAAQESLADSRRRQDRLRELIEEERKMIEVSAILEVKRREYERARDLAEKQLISRSRLEQVRGEMEALIAKITENEKVSTWKSEMEKLDQMIVPSNKKKKKGSPIIHQILFKKLEIQLSTAHNERSLLQVERDVDQKREQVATIQRLSNQLIAAENQIDSLEDQRKSIQEQLGMMQQLSTLGPTEFTVISPPSTGQFPIKSSRKKLFVIMLGALMMLSCTTIAGYDVLVSDIIPTVAQLQRLGIPVIANLNEAEAVADSIEESDDMRREIVASLALTIRREVQDHGAIVLFSGLSEDDRVLGLVGDLAECFSHRDERVLIVDCRQSEDGLGEFFSIVDEPSGIAATKAQVLEGGTLDGSHSATPWGLRNWLSFEADRCKDVILPSTKPGVDILLPGTSTEKDEFATIRMNELLTFATNVYSLVLLVGPDTSMENELQILASYVATTLFTHSADNRIDAINRSTVQKLYVAGAPLLGTIELACGESST